jgi:exosortase/archaeosortase family protein
MVKFFINGALLFGIWWVFYTFLRDTAFIHNLYEEITAILTKNLLIASKHFLNILGFETEVFGKTIRITGTGGVYLDRGCLGRNLMGLFAGFIIAYPGIIKKKLWYIPLGLVLITIINIFRISALAYIVVCCPEHVDINHHVIFKYTVYTLIFLMWYIWIKRVNIRPKKKSVVE